MTYVPRPKRAEVGARGSGTFGGFRRGQARLCGGLLRSVRRLVVAGVVVLAVVAVSGCSKPADQAQQPPKPAPAAGPAAPSDAGRAPGTTAPGADKSPPSSPAHQSTPARQALAQFNQGCTLLEQYEYEKAAQCFEEVLKACPDWTAARYNLALSYLNLQGKKLEDRSGEDSDSLQRARKHFEQVLAAEPNHLHALFSLGLYYQHLGNNEKALEYYERVYQADPKDAFVVYRCGEMLVGLGRTAEGTKRFEEATALDPGFVSAVYRLAMQYQRMRQPEKARPLIERFKQLNALELATKSFTVGQAYGESGKYYMALDAASLPLARPKPTQGPRILFSPQLRPVEASLKSWKWSGGTVEIPGIAAADVNGDSHLDLVLAGSGTSGEAAIWLGDGAGNFKRGETLADQVVSICAGDVNNDGHVDLWLGRAGADRLLIGDGKGRFQQAEIPVISKDSHLTACARLVDLDCDGDLDLLAFRLASGGVPAQDNAAPAASRIYNNNRDGTYVDIAPSLGLELAQTAVSALVYADFDNDRDLDLIIFPAKGRPMVWLNDRGGKYRFLETAATGLELDGATSATCGDVNKDGRQDLLVFTGGEVRLYLNRGGLRFEVDGEFAKRHAASGGTGGQLADMDNDGDLDLVIPDARRRDGTRGPALLINQWPQQGFVNAAEIDPGNLLSAIQTRGPASCVVADFNGDGKCDVLLAEMGQKPQLVENATQAGNYLALELRGTKVQDKKSRSNGSAIGARVEVRAGPLFQQYMVGVPSGPTAMPPLRIHAGLGDSPRVDWLRIVWPDSVLQAEGDLAAGRLVTITELNRKTSSCPHLFAWDGSRFAFVSDFGGVGGLGYLVAPGRYATPDPTEYVSIPRLQPLGDHYVLQVTEPLEEVVYLDQARLIAVDHPAGTEVWPREMAAVNAAPPPFELFCYSQTIEPLRAIDHRGVDVTDELRRVDRRYAGATDLDHRFDGFASEHFVELDFGDRLRAVSPQARVILFLYGWVEYAYSSTNYAASQAGLRLKAPSVQVLREGRWVELLREVGYPAGLNHMMTVELTGRLLPGDCRLRISTNMDLYWDRIFLAFHRADVRLVLTELAATQADLHYLGYPREYSPDGRRPNLYDYANVDSSVLWKPMAGMYTRYGDVTELVHQADDCFVIMAPGDELTLRFPAGALPAVRPGYRRSFILQTDTYTKDMDLYTAYPDTVEPLPFHLMRSYPYGPDQHYPDTERTRSYRQRFNTRQVRGW